MQKESNEFHLKIDKSVLLKSPLFDKSDLKTYWHSRTPYERLQYIEILRRMNYGHDAASGLRRVLDIAESK